MSITKQTSQILSKGVKVLTIKIDEDFVENNLIDLPFIYYYKSKEPITAITYKWTTSDGKNRAIEVRSSKYGIPTPYDYNVLLALFRIYIRQQGNKVVLIKDQDIVNFDELDNTVNFSFKELMEEMGYKSNSAPNKKKVEKAIETLVDTNIYNTSSGGLYNPFTKEYITDAKFQIGILDGYKTYNYVTATDENGNEIVDKNGEVKQKIDKKSVKDKCTIKIDKFFLKSLYYGNGKISDKNLRLSLKNDIARKIYLILNKWRNNRAEMFLKFETLYNRIPLNDTKDDYYRKRRVLEGLNELKETEYIIEYQKERDGVNIVFSNEKKLKIQEKFEGLLSKYNTYDEIVNQFFVYGIDDKTFNKCFQIHKIPYYQALLRFVEDRSDKIDNITSYIFKGLAIEEYKDIDSKYYNKD